MCRKITSNCPIYKIQKITQRRESPSHHISSEEKIELFHNFDDGREILPKVGINTQKVSGRKSNFV